MFFKTLALHAHFLLASCPQAGSDYRFPGSCEYSRLMHFLLSK
jgi:hypothetical protein